MAKIPESTLETLFEYHRIGRPPGGFVRAVLENDLMGAMGAADQWNRAALFEICGLVYNELDAQCHGSRERVAAWMERGGLDGLS